MTHDPAGALDVVVDVDGVAVVGDDAAVVEVDGGAALPGPAAHADRDEPIASEATTAKTALRDRVPPFARQLLRRRSTVRTAVIAARNGP